MVTRVCYSGVEEAKEPSRVGWIGLREDDSGERSDAVKALSKTRVRCRRPAVYEDSPLVPTQQCTVSRAGLKNCY